VSPDGEFFFSCGSDKVVRQWRMAPSDDMAAALAKKGALDYGADEEGIEEGEEAEAAGPARSLTAAVTAGMKRPRTLAHSSGGGSGGMGGARTKISGVEPVMTWTGKHGFNYIDHHWKSSMFCTASVGVHVWDHERSEPTHIYEWGADSVTTCRFNPAESGLIASTGSDRSICLYDVRTDSALRKVVLGMCSNALAWNPREPFHFTAANEDHNLYTFDMRKLDTALMVHKDHVGAVMDVAYAPTGREFVSGSYDRTVRIWRSDNGRSREVYHTKRMQRVFTVRFTGDAKYVLSGSDDTNVRIWKSVASAALGRALPRERAKADYEQALKRKFGHMPEIRKIANHRDLPRVIKKQKEMRVQEGQKARRRIENIRLHEGPARAVVIPEKKKRIVAEYK
jgi:WD repeat and SOF domain-containing protein 1